MNIAIIIIIIIISFMAYWKVEAICEKMAQKSKLVAELLSEMGRWCGGLPRRRSGVRFLDPPTLEKWAFAHATFFGRLSRMTGKP